MSELVEIPQDDIDSLIIEETFTIGKFSKTIVPIPWVKKKGLLWAFHKTIKSVMNNKDNLMECLPEIFEKMMTDCPVILELSTGIGRKSIEKLQLPEQMDIVVKVINVNRLADDAFKKKCIILMGMLTTDEQSQPTEPTIEQVIQSGES